MRTLRVLTVLLLIASSLTPATVAAEGAGRIEGLVAAIDGRAAAGYRVHLIDDLGQERGRSEVDAKGTYELRGVDAGSYSLALETPEGRFAAVEAPPLQVRAGHLMRRDLKLVGQDPAQPLNLAAPSYGMGTWWAGLSGGARIWTIVAIVVVAGVTAEALSSDEAAASQFAN